MLTRTRVLLGFWMSLAGGSRGEIQLDRCSTSMRGRSQRGPPTIWRPLTGAQKRSQLQPTLEVLCIWEVHWHGNEGTQQGNSVDLCRCVASDDLPSPFQRFSPLRIRILTSSARCTPAIRNWWSMVSSTKPMLLLCPWSWWSTRMPWATPLEHSKSTGMSSTNTVCPGLMFEENTQADVGRLSHWSGCVRA